MSFRVKLTVAISLLIAIAFGIGSTLMIASSFRSSLTAERQQALDTFQSVRNTLYLVRELSADADTGALTDTLSQMEQGGGWQALALSSGGQTLYQSGASALLNYDLPVPQGELCAHLSVEDRYGRGLVVLAAVDELTLMARFDLSGVYEMRREQQRLYVIVYVAVVSLGVAASVILSGALTGSLRKLTATVRDISAGDLSKRSALTTEDEFGQLSRDFDAMADKLEATIGRLEADVERQERFMGAVAHELKTPMTAMIGFADLLRQDDLEESTRLMAADHIFSESKRLEALAFKLQDLLLLKRDSFDLRSVPLRPFLADVERSVAPVLEQRGHRLVCQAPPGRVELEPDLVKSLLYNLIDNAAKAMDTPGTVTVTAAVIPGGCQFQVTDTGRGMDPVELEQITEPFYRVDKARSRSQGGAGLGLALCQQIARLHKGDLRFESAPGVGTRVTVTLCGKAGEGDA